MDARGVPARRVRRTVGILIVVALGLGALALTRHTGTSEPETPMTLDAALASFGGATQYFLRVPGIPGDVTVTNHANDIDVQSFSWNVTGQTRAAFTPLTITKFADPASPLLMKQAANQNALQTVTLFAEKPGSPAFGYYQLTLNNSKVTSFKQSGDRAKGILDTVSFSYTKLTLKYTKQSPTGGPGTVTGACWDIVLNAAC
jgi:type VI secretion system secreted protein Hcp